VIKVIKYFWPILNLSFLYSGVNYGCEPQDFADSWVGTNYDPYTLYHDVVFNKGPNNRLLIVITNWRTDILFLILRTLSCNSTHCVLFL